MTPADPRALRADAALYQAASRRNTEWAAELFGQGKVDFARAIERRAITQDEIAWDLIGQAIELEVREANVIGLMQVAEGRRAASSCGSAT